MKAVILAAGYATRLEPVTGGKIAKTLLEIEAEGKNQSILYFLLDKIKKIDCIREIIVVSNEKYFNSIEKACANYDTSKFITVISDGSTNKTNAVGANGGLKVANEYINEEDPKYADDIMVLASDNYFDLDLENIIDFYDKKYAEINETSDETKNVNVVVSKVYPDSEREFIANNFGILNVNSDKSVNSLDEKPGIENLKTNNVSLALYMFNKKDFNRINEYMLANEYDKKKRDSLGYFVNYIINNTNTYTFEHNGLFCDIGTPEEYYKMASKKNIITK